MPRLLAALGCLLALLLSTTAHAAGSPDLSVAVSGTGALYGEDVPVTITTSNPPGTYGYNLTYRVVLPAGASYVAGSAAVAPQVIADKPTAGATTLVFPNVSDISPNATETFSLRVRYDQALWDAGDLLPVTADAYAHTDARTVPAFTAAGDPVGPSSTGSGSATQGQPLRAIEVRKSEPSPEGELLRGLHDHPTVYTVTVRNNSVRPTDAVTVEDHLPAGLEFLGCGAVDNTTDAATNRGSTREYPGAGPIGGPALGGCVQPDLVDTVTTDPDGASGPLPGGVYTRVRWSPGLLAPGATRTFTYRAAVPLRANATTFTGAKPAAASLGQAANLDNNSGPEVTDEAPLRNLATASGTYQSPRGDRTVTDAFVLHRSAEDWRVLKSASSGSLAQGAITTWTLRLRTGEYKGVTGATVTDTLPDGLCPLGASNFAGPTASDDACDPVGGVVPSHPYATADEHGDGHWTLTWTPAEVPALAAVAPSTDVVVTFPTRTRSHYQEGSADARPLLTRDGLTNHVSTTGAVANRPALGGAAQQPDGTGISDVSEAGQSAGDPVVDKKVAAAYGGSCSASAYVQGPVAYRPGDTVCWEVEVVFPAALDTQPLAIADFMPVGTAYVAGSEAAAPGNTVTATLDDSAAVSGRRLGWTVTGTTVPDGSQVFRRRFATTVAPTTLTDGDVTGNLLKFSSSNTATRSTSQRDAAEYTLEVPEVGLTKGVQRVERGGTTVAGPFAANTDHRAVQGGDRVTFRVDVANTGSTAAEAVEVWDVLPSTMSCSSLVLPIPDGGTCTPAAGGDRLRWVVPTVAAGGTATVTYDLLVPGTAAPNTTFTNRAGVRSFTTPTNTGGTWTYVPAANIDPAQTTTNVPAAADVSDVYTRDAAATKAQTSSVTEAGNTATQATIGEEVTLTLTATIPAGTTLAGAAVLDDVITGAAARQPYVPGSATATLDGAALPAGFTLDTTGTYPRVVFPADFAAPAGATDSVVRLQFKVRVADDAATAAGAAPAGVLQDRARLTWTGQTRQSGVLTTTVVEPRVTQLKSHAPAGRLSPGDVVTYTLTTGNAAASATAHGVVATDTLPVGLTPIGAAPGNAPLADGDPVPGSGGAVWNAAARTITRTIGTVAPGATVVTTYRAKVDDPAVGGSALVNSVAAAGASLDAGGRTAGSRYRATASDTVLVGLPSVTKTGTPATATVGQTVAYTLRATVPAGLRLYDVTVRDTLPDGLELVGFGTPSCVSGCSAPDAQHYPSQPGAAGTTELAWDLGDFDTPLGQPKVVELPYTVFVRAAHAGSGAAVLGGQTAVNSARVSSDRTDLKSFPAAIPATFDDTTTPVTTTTTVVEPKVAIDKALRSGVSGPYVDGPVTAVAGSALAYRLTVRNTGDAPAHDVAVTDTPDAELTGVQVDPLAGATITDGWNAADRDLAWTIDTIPAGGSVTLTYAGSLVPSDELTDGQTVDNTAAVPSYWALPQATRAADPGRPYRQYADGGSDTARAVVDLPTLTLAKTTGLAGAPETGDARIGQAFPWRIVVTNTSATATASGVRVSDRLPADWTYTAPTTGAGEPTVTADPAGDGLEWTVPSLAPGASVTLAYAAVPGIGAATGPAANVNEARVTRATDASGATTSAGGAYGTGPDTATATLRVPHLVVEKTPDAGAATAGTAAGFTVRVRNTGDAAASDVVVEDVLPAGLRYRAGDATATPAAGFAEAAVTAGPGAGETSVRWTVGSIGAGDAVAITLPVTVDASVPDGAVRTNHAAAHAAERPTPVTDTGSLTVSAAADLRVTKTGAATYTPGTQYTWQIRARNLGPSDAVDATVTDVLPAGTTFVSADAPCTAAAGTVTCALGTVPSGFDETYDVTVAVAPGVTAAPLDNTARLTSPTDPTPAEDTFGPAPAPLADVSLRKDVAAPAILKGHATTFTLVAHNAGPSVARGVTVSDPLPAGLAFVSASPGCTEAGGTVTCPVGTLAPGADATFEVAVRGAANGDWTNTATVTTTTPQPSGDAPDADGADVTVGPVAGLSIAKTAPATVAAGGRLTWTLDVRNAGPDDATGVTVTDPLPAGVAFVAAGAGCVEAARVVICSIGALAAGATATREVTVDVPVALADSVVRNRATVRGDQGDDDPADDAAEAQTTVGPAADLAVDKTGPATVAADGTASWTIVVSNRGPSTATGVQLIDALPEGTTLVSATPSQGTCGAAVECALGDLASGAAAQVQVAAHVPAALEGRTLVNRATVHGDRPDPDPSNDADDATTTVGPPDAGNFDLALAKRVVTAAPVKVGLPLSYALTVTNRGPATATAVRVTDTLPSSVAFVSAAVPGGTCARREAVVSCRLGVMAAGATRTARITVRPLEAGRLRNTASVASAVADEDPSNDVDRADTRVTAPPAEVTVDKTVVTRGPLEPGDRARLRIVVRNTSANSATRVVLCDVPARGTAYVRTPGARLRSGRACWDLGLLRPGAKAAVGLVVRVGSTGRPRLPSAAVVTAANTATRRDTVEVRTVAGSGRAGGVTG